MSIAHRAVCDVCGKEAPAVPVNEVSTWGSVTLGGGGMPAAVTRYDHPPEWTRVAWHEGAILREAWACAWPCVEQLAQAKDVG